MIKTVKNGPCKGIKKICSVNALRRAVNNPKVGLRGRPTMVGEAKVARLSEDEMVQQRDAEQLGPVTKALSQEPILWARGRIAGGVIMDAQEGGGIHQNQRLKNFSRMDNRQGEGANRDNIHANDPMLGVETADHKLLSIQTGETRSEQGSCRSGGLNRLRDRRADLFTDERDAIARDTIRLERRTRPSQPSRPDALCSCFFHLFSSLKKFCPTPHQPRGWGTQGGRCGHRRSRSRQACAGGGPPGRVPKGLIAAPQRWARDHRGRRRTASIKGEGCSVRWFCLSLHVINC